MADPLHQQRLIEAMAKPTGRKDWLTFKLRVKRIDLSTADFTEQNLCDFDLSDANLSTTIFLGANLAGADLSDAILNFSDLRRAGLRNACLDRADLRASNLQEAELIDACLERANLRDCKLIGANLIGADLSGAVLADADLRGASLKYTRLSGAVLTGANVSEADLTGAVLDKDAIPRMKNFEAAQIDDRKYREMRCRLSTPSSPLLSTEPPAADVSQPATPIPPFGDAAAGPAEAAEDEITGRDEGVTIPRRSEEPDLNSTAGCCELLGVPMNASRSEVVTSFRQKAKVFHPDCVGHLSSHLQELAGEEFMRLHKAYEFLTRKTTRPLRRNVIWPPDMPRDLTPYDYTIEQYEVLAVLNPGNTDILYNLAWKYFEAGRHEESRRGFEQVLDLEPNDEDAQFNLVIVRLSIELELPWPGETVT